MSTWGFDSPGWEVSKSHTDSERTYLTKTVEYENCIVTVNRPVLSDAEYTAQLEKIKNAARDVLIAHYKVQAEKERRNKRV